MITHHDDHGIREIFGFLQSDEQCVELSVCAENLVVVAVVSVFPFLIVLISLSALMGQTETGNQFILLVYENLPENVVGAIRGPVDTVLGETTGNILTISILVALWTTMRGVNSARIAVMKAYGIKFQKPAMLF